MIGERCGPRTFNAQCLQVVVPVLQAEAEQDLLVEAQAAPEAVVVVEEAGVVAEAAEDNFYILYQITIN